MTNQLSERSSQKGRILVYSQRNLYEPEVWRSTFHEFEELLHEFETVDIIAPKSKKWYNFRRNNAQRVGKYTSFLINPGVENKKITREYDLFLSICEKPSELLNINVLKGWKDYCKTTICWIAELWVKDIPTYKAETKVLSQFDHVLFNVAHSVKPIQEKIKSKCHYLPAGVDTEAFCPYPNTPSRFIDVLSIGRRSEKIHESLLKMAKESKIFYFYDTQDILHTYNIKQHRFLMSNLAKRSRYFIVNPGKFDSNNDTGGQIEFGYRYFEGAAAGAILIGEDPKTNQFREYFFWDEPVIHIPFDSENIETEINNLDGQPERQNRIRRNNVIQSLLNHDWVYRWEDILKIAGLRPSTLLEERKLRLKRLAEIVDQKF